MARMAAADRPDRAAGLAKSHAFSLDAYHEPGPSLDLVPAQPHLLIAIEDFFSAAECEALVAAAHAVGLQPPSASDLTPRKNEAYLNREKASFVDLAFAERVWQRLRPFLPDIDGRTPVGLHGDNSKDSRSMMSYYRYARGMRFDQHVDQSWKGSNAGEETEYTLLFYLNSQGEPIHVAEQDCEQPLVGGDTVFMATAKAELCRVAPKAGMALLHAHGRRCLMHYAEEVSRGAKYVLRADVLYRRVAAAEAAAAAATADALGAIGGDGGGGKHKKGKRK